MATFTQDVTFQIGFRFAFYGFILIFSLLQNLASLLLLLFIFHSSKVYLFQNEFLSLRVLILRINFYLFQPSNNWNNNKFINWKYTSNCLIVELSSCLRSFNSAECFSNNCYYCLVLCWFDWLFPELFSVCYLYREF